MKLREIITQALVGGLAGICAVLCIAAFQIRSLEDLDHLGSATVGVLTIPLVILSFVLFRETKQTRIENTEARLVVTIEPNRIFGFFDVVVENVGRGTAFDVQTELVPDIIIREDGEQSASLGRNRFISPAVIKPGQSFRQYLGRHNEISPEVADVICRYRDEHGQSKIDRNVIDIRMYEETGQLGPDNYLAEISKQLEKIAKVATRVSLHDRIQVDAYDTSDRADDDARRYQRRKAIKLRMKDVGDL